MYALPVSVLPVDSKNLLSARYTSLTSFVRWVFFLPRAARTHTIAARVFRSFSATATLPLIGALSLVRAIVARRPLYPLFTASKWKSAAAYSPPHSLRRPALSMDASRPSSTLPLQVGSDAAAASMLDAPDWAMKS